VRVFDLDSGILGVAGEGGTDSGASDVGSGVALVAGDARDVLLGLVSAGTVSF
jgi:hypothetical protein